MKWQIIKAKAEIFYHSLHQVIKPVMFVTAFITEFIVILIMIHDLFTGKNWYSGYYSYLVTILIGGLEIWMIYDIKTEYNITGKPSGIKIGAYVVTLIIFFMAALAFNLRTFHENSQTIIVNETLSSSLQDEINENKDFIKKYNLIAKTTNDNNAMFKYRNLANELRQTNDVLLLKLGEHTNISEPGNTEIDSFKLLNEIIPIPVRWLKVIFLSAIWGVLAYILFMSMPAGKGTYNKKEKSLKTNNETNIVWLKENCENVKKFISAMYKKKGESNLVKTTNDIAEEIGINQEDADKIRDMFCYYVYFGEGKNKKFILSPLHGKTEANIEEKELLELFETFLK